MTEHGNPNLDPFEQQLEAGLRDLDALRPDAGFRARLRADFVSGALAAEAEEPPAAAPSPGRGKVLRPWFWAAVPTALAAGLAVIVLLGGGDGWRVRNLDGSGRIVAAGRTVDAGDAEAVAEAVAGGGELQLGGAVGLDVLWDDVLVMGLAPGTVATLPVRGTPASQVLELTVATGQVSVRTGPGFPGRTLRIVTGDGATVVTGTAVDVFKNDDLTCVCVLEGTVEVEDRAHTVDRVPAGMRKVMFADERSSRIIAIEAAHEATLQRFLDRNRDVFHW